MTIVEMSVHMDCAGCEKKIRKAIQRMEGVDDVEIDMERQKVTVNGNVEQKKVLKAQQQHYHPGGGQAHAAHAARPTSSYNYYKHGYDDSLLYGANSAVVGSRATDYFSDENPQSCSVM
uniref:HMA domain-containing protein n=1 Tax=Oryza brachyantha TaxID=4533 RepID=J3L487_ORYBR